jgi:hypothetical protein
MNIKVFLTLFIPYIVIRASSYVITPHPYLWWHGIIDISVIFIYLLTSFVPLWSKIWNKIYKKESK